MTAWSLVQIALALGVLVLAAIPLGRYMARVYEDSRPSSAASWRRSSD